MTPAQEHKAFAELLRWLEDDWVQLPAVVCFVNEAIDFTPYNVVTDDARGFLAHLLKEEEVVAGSVGASGFAPWAGTKEEILERVLSLIPIGKSVGEEWSMWFSRPEKKRANQALVPTPASVTPAAGAPVAPDAGAAHL
jgi:hypothetical protein